MLLIRCHVCGAEGDETDFHYGGEAHIRRPASHDPGNVSDEAQRDYLFLRRNPKGLWLRVRLNFGARWGWKEPRTTLFAPAWLEIFPEARIVHVVRDAEAAASSIRERELKFQAAGDPPTPNLADLNYCTQLVQTYLAAGEQLADSPNYQRLQFEELQANPPAMLEQLGNFCDLRTARRDLSAAAASIRPARVRSTFS